MLKMPHEDCVHSGTTKTSPDRCVGVTKNTPSIFRGKGAKITANMASGLAKGDFAGE